ncbi:hypothetical protein PbJCM13498_29010 [Prolixibacter bellariivorans]|uniref:Uncharacterized protein n=1 Tax=Prolixibacter bellariivorans TaxID=314319 RepID=A0A5M4B293_9BACT|nr:hypothetical protein PbJCM13498_29010 [Prolixibacter bellariivorans]
MESAIKVAEDYNSNPMNFVLITDITNNVQVGDLMGIVDGQFIIAEIKEGEKKSRNFGSYSRIKRSRKNTSRCIKDLFFRT